MKNIIPFNLFEAKQIGTLYHFTGMMNAYAILRNNEMTSNREIGDMSNVDNTDLKKYKSRLSHINPHTNYISFTRNKNLDKMIPFISVPFTTRIDFDGTKLSNLKYGLRPVSYFRTRAHDADESEEMVLVDKETLSNVRKYITKVNVPTYEKFLEELEYYFHEPMYYTGFFVCLEEYGKINTRDLDSVDEYKDRFTDEIKIDFYDFILKGIQKYTTTSILN